MSQLIMPNPQSEKKLVAEIEHIRRRLSQPETQSPKMRSELFRRLKARQSELRLCIQETG